MFTLGITVPDESRMTPFTGATSDWARLMDTKTASSAHTESAGMLMILFSLALLANVATMPGRAQNKMPDDKMAKKKAHEEEKGRDGQNG
jgi:hypothetical protein